MTNEPSEDPKTRLRQLRTITAAYKSITASEPVLPLPHSPLPALLALRSTLNLIDQVKTSIRDTKYQIGTARARQSREEHNLQDARSLTQALEQRISKLQLENEDQLEESPEDMVTTLIREQQSKHKQHKTEIRRLVIAFNNFIITHLASMIAAEELGGPNVGDLFDISDAMLEAGFNAQGNPRKARLLTTTSEGTRKRRNEEVWGPVDDNADAPPKNEKNAAAADFRALVEDLLNASADEDGGEEEAFVKLKRESAGVRFLVRAKIAQFHPNNARKLRLIDFGKELESG